MGLNTMVKTKDYDFEIPEHLVYALEYGSKEANLERSDKPDYDSIINEIALLMTENNGSSYTWQFSKEPFFRNRPEYCSFSCNCVDAKLTIFLKD